MAGFTNKSLYCKEYSHGSHQSGSRVGTRGNMVAVVKRNAFEDSRLLGFNMCQWQVVPNIKKDHVPVTFKDNQYMNKISLPVGGMEPQFFGRQANGLVTTLAEVF
jgi:hypothetical protein